MGEGQPPARFPNPPATNGPGKGREDGPGGRGKMKGKHDSAETSVPQQFTKTTNMVVGMPDEHRQIPQQTAQP